MKKLFTILFLAVSAGYFAQTFSVFKANSAGVISNTLTNGGGYTVATTAGSAGHPSPLLEDKIIVRNNSATTQTYNVTRTVLSQNPPLILDGSTNTPNTYFCFGYTCFGSDVSQPDAGNYTTLTAAGTPSANNQDAGELFVVYFQEGTTQGNYLVQYRLFNINNPNDTLLFRVGYNQGTTVGIKTLTKSVDLISEIYPNPAPNSSKIFFNLSKDEDLKFQVYNSLGSSVYSGNSQRYSAGKNQMPMDASELNTGVYFITISSATASITKRLIITK